MIEPLSAPVPVDDTASLRAIFASTRCVLLDFDGPVCAVFAGYPAAEIAVKMRAQLLAEDLPMTARGRATDDPMVVLFEAAAGSPEGQRLGEASLAAAELVCIKTAEPTPDADDFLRAAKDSGRPVTIVSNNSEPAIRAYLDRRGLGDLVRAVVGRDPHDASLMKPDPHLLLHALETVPCKADEAVLIGDSVTDVQAAHAARVGSIGLANKAGKLAPLVESSPSAVITGMIYAVRAAQT